MCKIKILLATLVGAWVAAATLSNSKNAIKPLDTSSRSISISSSSSSSGLSSISARGMSDKFVFGINTTMTWQHKDKHPSSISASTMAPTNDTGAGKSIQPLLTNGEENSSDEIHNDVHYEIHKNSQEQHLDSHNRLTSALVDAGKAADSSSVPSSSSLYFERAERQESRAPAGNKYNLVLHRHKRYLLFPEGSSFQLVFDLIVPIVDYTNFAIMGITCAVAWELPSKPASEIVESLRNKLNDGTLGLNRRNDNDNDNANSKIDDTKEGSWNGEISPYHSAAATTPFASIFSQKTRPWDAYYNNPWQKPQNFKTNQAYAFHQQPAVGRNPEESAVPASGKDHPPLPSQRPSASWQNDGVWWEHNKNRIQSQWHENQWKWQTDIHSQRHGRNRKVLIKQPKHRIYPVFGKRRRRNIHHRHTQHNDELTQQLNEIHLQQHLDTRRTLFGKIEKLYKTRGHNGTACVSRTLCEIQKLQSKHSRKQQPDTFVMELLRAIFTLPLDDASLAIKSMESSYVDAMMRAHDIENCNRHYNGCALPTWQRIQL